ncbi:uncharacterized protein LOC8284529 [Ricinus communis]|uniref:uncharacterized protein LOC8284529 n=1 Tax=Ricinus communis TaxID=3988 RepID=UPI00201AF14D|nr:uncharacterized protein LOC8284529 [Ricinus communis]
MAFFGLTNRNQEAEINPLVSHGNLFEFDEADVWSSNSNNNNNNSRAVSQSEAKKMLPRKGGGRNNMVVTKTPVTCASSLPVNIPDWSKIYRVDHRGQSNNLDDQDSDYDILNHDDDAYDGRVPPHEYLARRGAAFF